MPITRTPMVDDDGSGTTGTIINNAWKVELYDQIDAGLASAGGGQWPGGVTGNLPFPATQVPSAGVNVLDDYEEGTWTPVLTADGGASGQAYLYRNGTYVKIGRWVFAYGDVRCSAKGTLTGNVQFSGLPFAATTNFPVPVANFYAFAATTAFVGARTTGTSSVELFVMRTGAMGSCVAAQAADITDSLQIQFLAIYMTAN